MRAHETWNGRRDERSTIAEVLFDADGERLLVAVETDLSRDGLVSDALTDIVATAQDRGVAETQLRALGAELGWHVRIEGDGNVRVITLAPNSRRAS